MAATAQKTKQEQADPYTQLNVDLNGLLPQDTLFYTYLFGQSTETQRINPLEQEVLTKLDSVLSNPQAVLSSLPVLPQSVVTLTSMLNKDDFNVDAFVEVVEQEPGIASELIKLANSAQYKRGEKEVTDLTQAFMLIGATGISEHILGRFIRQMTRVSPIYFKLFGDKIWQHSNETASLAKQLAGIQGGDKEAAFLAGLMHDVGKMVIFHLMVESFRTNHPDHKPNALVFKKLLADKSMQLSASLLTLWEMPKGLCEAVQDMANLGSGQQNMSQLGIIISQANVISELCLSYEAKLLDDEALEQALSQTPLSEAAEALIRQRCLANDPKSDTAS